MSESENTGTASSNDSSKQGVVARALDLLEYVGNLLPDPAVLFLIGLFGTWGLSWWLSQETFVESLPGSTEPIAIVNLMTLDSFAGFLSGMVDDFVTFPPLGVVLVALLGVGVAEHSGFINACLKSILALTPSFLLTPMLLLVAVVSHTAADAGYVLVIPLGGVMFYAAGRHPLAGIGAAFAGVSGGFSANFIPSGIDPLLSGFTQSAANIVDPELAVNPLCNLFFTGASSALIIGVGWILTDWVVEPRLRRVRIDGDPEQIPKMENLGPRDIIGMIAGVLSIIVGLVALGIWAAQPDSALRAAPVPPSTVGSLTSYRPAAPLMHSIVPLIFLVFIIPGVVHGYISGKFKSHRDIVKGMANSMQAMGYYLVLVFFAALFIAAFTDSNIGILLAVKGANFLKDADAPKEVTIIGIILLAAMVNLLIGSASAKWAMLAPVFVPMLMILGLSPELTQAAYRIGDSSTNIITPMMPYFPLVVVFCQRYVKKTGVGTVGAMMLPYSFVFLTLWTVFLLFYWLLGIPLGLQADYSWSAPG